MVVVAIEILFGVALALGVLGLFWGFGKWLVRLSKR